MNSRERVLAALDHREPDRVPIDLGGTVVTSITVRPYVALRERLGLPAETLRILDVIQQLPYLSDDVLDRLGVDTRMVQLPPRVTPGTEIFDDGDYRAFIDRWGAKLRMPKEGGFYFDYVEPAIGRLATEALDAYAWPEPDPSGTYDELAEIARRLYQGTDHVLMGAGGLVGEGIFEQGCRLAGMEEFMMALASDEPLAERVLERITEMYEASIVQYLEAVGPYLHVYQYGDDVSTQDGWMISPDTYARLIKPRQRRLVEAVKKHSNAKFMFHCCGAASGLYPHLVDIGVDVVNPVQVSARGMDTARLKREFGRDLVFWGGGVDTQRVLPFGTPDQVRDEVRRRIDDLAPGGGFVFAAVHNVQAMVPPENIVAAYETAAEYGRYGT